MIEHKTTHNAEALARIAQFLKGKSNITKVIGTVNLSVQDEEDTAFSLFQKRILANATFAQLDVIGRIVGQPRLEADDTTYRIRISARVAANRSRGNPIDIYKVFFALLGSTALLQYVSEPPAGFSFRVLDPPLDPTLIGLYSGFLHDSRAAGVRAILEWIETAPSDTFSFARSTRIVGDLDGPVSGFTLPVLSTAGFPDSGTLRFFEGLPDDFSATYTGRAPTQFTNVTIIGVHSASDGDIVIADALDKGLGDTGDLSAGGAFSGAKES